MKWEKSSDKSIRCDIWHICVNGLAPNCQYMLYEHEPPRVKNRIVGVYASPDSAKAAARRMAASPTLVPEE